MRTLAHEVLSLAARIGTGAVQQTRQLQWGVIPEFLGQEIWRQVLITHGPQEASDRQRADRGRAAVRGRWKWPAMDHRVPDLHAGWPAVRQNAPTLTLQDREEPPRDLGVGRFHLEGGGQLPFEPLRQGHESLYVRATNHEQ